MDASRSDFDGDFAGFDARVSGGVTPEELQAIKDMAWEVIEGREDPHYRSKGQRYRPWPSDPVSKVTLDGQANINLPLRATFPAKPPQQRRMAKNPMRKVHMEGPEGDWITCYAREAPPRL